MHYSGKSVFATGSASFFYDYLCLRLFTHFLLSLLVNGRFIYLDIFLHRCKQVAYALLDNSVIVFRCGDGWSTAKALN